MKLLEDVIITDSIEINATPQQVLISSSILLPNREISYAPVSRLLRIFFPESSFHIEPTGKGCVFTGGVHLRIGRLAKTLAKRRLEQGLISVKKHMKEEGENLKRILERANSQNRLIETV
jgi:hypothetical protein